MDDDAIEPRAISLGRMFPWTRLLRGIGLALDGRKMILAALGIVVMWAGWQALDAAFAGATGDAPRPSPVPGGIREIVRPGSGASWLVPWHWGLWSWAAFVLTDPIRLPASPFVEMFRLGGGAARFGHAALGTLWSLLVWGIFGAAIARISAVQLATTERVGVVKALGFAVRKVVPLVWAPVGALLGIAFFAALCALLGLLYRIPGPVGATIGGILAFLPLMAGVVMTLILVGLAAGWPLMVTTIATEGEDAFDALSRSYSYVYQRPMLYGSLLVVAGVVGTVGFLVVLGLSALVLRLAAWGLAFGAPDATLVDLFGSTPSVGGLAAAIHGGWVSVVALLTYGWVYAYFWSSVTQVYLLLRHDVDGASFDDVALATSAGDPVAPGPDGDDPSASPPSGTTVG